MKKVVERCLGKLIVSCQAYEDTPLYGAENMKKMVECAVLGGAEVVRVCWKQDIEAARTVSDDLIIIGINKIMSKDQTIDDIFITPTFEAAKDVIDAKADILALDARITPKRSQGELIELLKQIREYAPDIGIMADCSNLEECLFSANSGYVDIVSTTLSGKYKQIEGPDLELLRELKNKVSLPINAEGRIWELKDIDDVVEAGADMITIGTAITRPHLITERFINHYRKVRGLGN